MDDDESNSTYITEIFFAQNTEKVISYFFVVVLCGVVSIWSKYITKIKLGYFM